MSRQWLRRFGAERPVPSTTSPFAPRPFAVRAPRPALRVSPAIEPPTILPIAGSPPSEPLVQFTLKDARRWVKENNNQSGYPKGWNKIPLKSQIESYIEEKKAGWQELEAALELKPSRKRKKEQPLPSEEKPEKTPPRKKRKVESEEEELPEELEEKQEQVENLATVRQIFLDVMKELGVKGDLTKAIVVDLDLQSYGTEGLKFLRQSSHRQIASCFETAKRLLDLVGDPDSDALNSWSTKQTMDKALPQLIKDLREHKDASCIYRCGIGGVAHGFTIILQNGRADLVQGFAGEGGESLAENLESVKTGYAIEALIAQLTKLLSRNPQETLDAQNELFSGSVDIEKIPRQDGKAVSKARKNPDLTEAHKDEQTDKTYQLFYRDLAKDVFQFERRGLFPQEQLRKRIADKVRTNLEILQGRRK